MEDSLSKKSFCNRRSWESGVDDVGTNPDNIISLLSVSFVFPRTFYILEFTYFFLNSSLCDDDLLFKLRKKQEQKSNQKSMPYM